MQRNEHEAEYGLDKQADKEPKRRVPGSRKVEQIEVQMPVTSVAPRARHKLRASCPV